MPAPGPPILPNAAPQLISMRTLACTPLLVMPLARCAYPSVRTASSTHSTEGDSVATMHVRQFPPSASCSMRVSFESR